jgi:hypothetical protein
MLRKLTALAALAVALTVISPTTAPADVASARASASWDCKRVISAAEWRRILGTSIKVQYGESQIDCLWSHRGPGSSPQGLMSAYPAVYKIWHQIYVGDATGSKRFGQCEEADRVRSRLSGFHGDFGWTVEKRDYGVLGTESYCPSAKTLKSVTRSVYVVHHRRLFKLGTSTAYGERPGTREPTLSQLVQLAHKATHRF